MTGATLLRKARWNAFTLRHARDEARLPYRPLHEILDVQARRVRAIVAHAYEHVPHYHEVMVRDSLHPRDFRTADDLAWLPIVTGEEVARAPDRFLSRAHRLAAGLTILSSGTSGQPKTIHYDARALFLALAHGHRQRVVLAEFVGRRFAYREMNAVRSGSVSVQIRNFYQSHSWVPRNLDFERARLSPRATFEDSIARMNSFQPDVLRGYGSHLGALFRGASVRDLPVVRPSAIVYGADRMPDDDRQLIENEFGVPVLSTYQAVEALRIAFQCERRQGFHVSADQVAVRVVNERGAALGPEEAGEIVISNLTNHATVLLNYKLGDRVTWGRSSCPCGRTLPILQRIEGRADDLVALPDGEVAHPLAVLEGLRTVSGVAQVQLVQEELRRFRLRLVPARAGDGHPTSAELSAALRSMLGEDIVVEVERLEAIPPGPSGKVRAVVSHCLRDRGSTRSDDRIP